MLNDKTVVADGVTAQVWSGKPQPERKTYTVMVELFKNGKKYKKGSKVELDQFSADNFKKLKEIK